LHQAALVGEHDRLDPVPQTDALKAAGFPITRIERRGSHYDADTDTTGTDYDLRTLLLPHLSDAWLAP
jgi:hypothetical protein